MNLTPTWVLQRALDTDIWPNGTALTDRERELVKQLVAARHENETLQAQVDALAHQYRGAHDG